MPKDDMLDDLRNLGFDEDDNDASTNDQLPAFDGEAPEKRFLGMTAVERMFLSMFIFLNILVIGTALLLVTGRLQF